MRWICLLPIIMAISCVPKKQKKQKVVMDSPGLLCFWDFQNERDNGLTSKGVYNYTLTERNGQIERSPDGIFGSNSLKIKRGQWLDIKRKDCPGLDIDGKSGVSIIAWIKREADNPWQFIAGMWNERDKQRQYGMFMSGSKKTNYISMTRTPAEHQIHGYVSDVGGATPGKSASFSYGTGKTFINKNEWYMVAYTYDNEYIRVFVNGELDSLKNHNPFKWNKPIFKGEQNGSDFTVAERAIKEWSGYPEQENPPENDGFGGYMGGLAVFDRALSPEQLLDIYKTTMP